MPSMVDRKNVVLCHNKEAEWPYLPEAILRARIEERIVRRGECWIAVCWADKGHPILALSGRQKHRKRAQINHLTWWLKHKQKIVLPQTLRSTCGNRACVNPDHREIFNRVRCRSWSAIEVRRMRESYWGTESRVGGQPANIKRHGAIARTARHFGVKHETIQNFLKGRGYFDRWGAQYGTREDILDLHQIHVAAAERDARASRSAVTMKSLAKERGVALTTIAKMLRGDTYRAAGGPTSKPRSRFGLRTASGPQLSLKKRTNRF